MRFGPTASNSLIANRTYLVGVDRDSSSGIVESSPDVGAECTDRCEKRSPNDSEDQSIFRRSRAGFIA